MSKLIDIAKKARVSLATVSLALNDNPRISKKTKEKIKKLAKELNYFPNLNAQRLAKGKSYNINIMLNSNYFFKSPNIYYLKVLGGIIEEAAKTEYTIGFSFFGKKGEDYLNERKVLINTDGIIVLDVIGSPILLRLKKSFKVPILLIDNHKKHSDSFGVDNDDLGGAYKATKYLIDKGHKAIGYLGIPPSHPLGKQCWLGFKKALNENSLKEKLAYRKCSFGINSGRKAIESIISQGTGLPSAFFCVNDYIAIGAIEEAKRNNLKVPDDISFVGMDDMELSSEIEPPLTTIRISMKELGKSSLNKIIQLINGEYQGQKKTIIENELIIRNSCKDLKKENSSLRNKS